MYYFVCKVILYISSKVKYLLSHYFKLCLYVYQSHHCQVIVLSWLFSRGVEILQSTPLGDVMSLEDCYRLYGILHSIILILSDKIHTSGRPSSSVSSEFLLLMFTRDSRYNTLYPLLLTELDKTLKSSFIWYVIT